MSGQSTAILDPVLMDKNVEPKKFTFDQSYWSHDGFEEREDGYLCPTTTQYADQVGQSWGVKKLYTNFSFIKLYTVQLYV